MSKIRLTEQELIRMIEHVINEVGEDYYTYPDRSRVVPITNTETWDYTPPQQPQKPQQQSQPQQQTYTNNNALNYTPSDSILTQIKQFEGWHQGWQKDPKGYPTTGWGFKQTPQLKKRFPRGMNKTQADNYFYNEIIPSMTTTFRDSVPSIGNYNQNQLDALFDLFYNVGPKGFTSKSPKLQNALANGDTQTILKEMNHGENDPAAPGLAKRRNFERQLFMTPV